MKVWIVTAGWDYEGEDVIMVATTEVKANFEKQRLQDMRRWDNVEVEEWPLDESSES